ncbi:MAG TPA: YciI family protein [Candidatus Cybelea sp.]|nr:YciI family protein [Candidatus Cybelea sp.]
MLYAILCYNDENVIAKWSQAEDDAVMARLGGIAEKLAARGKLGPVARLVPTKQAKALRKGSGGPAAVTDGPFAETKEHLLGFYLVDCKDVDEAVGIAKELQAANSGPSAYEIRPVAFYTPGTKPVERVA